MTRIVSSPSCPVRSAMVPSVGPVPPLAAAGVVLGAARLRSAACSRSRLASESSTRCRKLRASAEMGLTLRAGPRDADGGGAFEADEGSAEVLAAVPATAWSAFDERSGGGDSAPRTSQRTTNPAPRRAMASHAETRVLPLLTGSVYHPAGMPVIPRTKQSICAPTLAIGRNWPCRAGVARAGRSRGALRGGWRPRSSLRLRCQWVVAPRAISALRQ